MHHSLVVTLPVTKTLLKKKSEQKLRNNNHQQYFISFFIRMQTNKRFSNSFIGTNGINHIKRGWRESDISIIHPAATPTATLLCMDPPRSLPTSFAPLRPPQRRSHHFLSRAFDSSRLQNVFKVAPLYTVPGNNIKKCIWIC